MQNFSKSILTAPTLNVRAINGVCGVLSSSFLNILVRPRFVKCFASKCGDDSDDGGKKDDKPPGEVCPICKCPCDGSACSPNMYDCRKYGHCLPGNNRMPFFEPIRNIPTDVFRCTTGEILGPGGQASKCRCYPNPEYFSYHHMTFYDMHLVL